MESPGTGSSAAPAVRPRRARLASASARRRTALAFVLLAVAGLAPAAAIEPVGPEIARVLVQGRDGSRELIPGQAFFLAVDNRAGAVAVTTGAHLPEDLLADLDQIELRAGSRGRRIATSRGLLVPAMGTPDGGGLRVLHLEGAPEGVVKLAPQGGPGSGPALRVRIPGPVAGGRGWGGGGPVEGSVAVQEGERIWIDLDTPIDLRGREGAPVIATLTGRVIGVLQPTPPRTPDRRALATPIDRVVWALQQPLAGGAGLPFAVRRPRPGASPPTGVDPRNVDPTPPDGLIRPQPAPTRVKLAVEVPAVPELAVPEATCGVFVAGQSEAESGPGRRFDVVFVLDTSGSTAAASGADIDRDGELGHSTGTRREFLGAPSSDPGDSILAAEVAAARQVLARLSATTTRVGVIRFAGRAGSWPGAQDPAYVQVPLTDDYERVERALNVIEALGPSGQTHMAAAVELALEEFERADGLGPAAADDAAGDGKPAPEEADRARDRILLFFTDGQPTLPYALPFVHDNVARVLEAADRARAARVTIHSFAIGPEALAGPLGPIELADRTGGVFTPVRDPADLIHVVADVQLADVEAVLLRNVTTGRFAHHLRVGADGPWSGLVPLGPGLNEIEVEARATDGVATTARLRVRHEASAETQVVPPGWTALQEDLLRACLEELREANRAAEREYAERVRKQLLVEIEAERAKARERAARQRKELEIRPEAEPYSRQ